MLVSEIIGAQREKVEIVRDGARRSINIGRKISGEIEMLQGANPEHPWWSAIANTGWGQILLRPVDYVSRARYGRVWDFDGKSMKFARPLARSSLTWRASFLKAGA